MGRTAAKLRQIDRSYECEVPEVTKAKSFVKFEVGTSMPTKARLIQGNVNEITAYQHPEEYCALSNALKEPLCFDHDGVAYTFHYAGGHNHDGLSDLFSQAWSKAGRFALIDERDGKNWDSTMQEPLLRAEAELYEFLGLRAAKSFLARSSRVKGSISCRYSKFLRVVVKYITAWKRLSGDWNTSVGNTLISMLIVLVAVTRLPVGLRPTRVVGFFMGDDYLGVYSFLNSCDPMDLHKALDYQDARMGITPVRAIFDDPLFVSFISLGLWPRRCGGYQFVPHPARQMVKLFASTKTLTVNNHEVYRSQICFSFWSVYRGFEMMQRFLKLHYTRSVTKRAPFYSSHLLTALDREVDWKKGFVIKYGIPFTATFFDPCLSVGLVHHPLIPFMLEFECSDPPERRGNVSGTRIS